MGFRLRFSLKPIQWFFQDTVEAKLLQPAIDADVTLYEDVARWTVCRVKGVEREWSATGRHVLVGLKIGCIPNEIAIQKRDNDQQNHWL